MEWYCCLEQDNSPAVFMTQKGKTYNIWLQLIFQRDPNTLKPAAFICVTCLYPCSIRGNPKTGINRGLINYLANALDNYQGESVAIGLERYQLNSEAFMTAFNVYCWLDNHGLPVRGLPDLSQKQIIVSGNSWNKREYQINDGAHRINLFSEKGLIHLIHPMSLPFQPSMEYKNIGLYAAISNLKRYAFHQPSGARIERLSCTIEPQVQQVNNGLMCVSLTRNQPGFGLPEKITLYCSGDMLYEELLLSFAACSPFHNSIELSPQRPYRDSRRSGGAPHYQSMAPSFNSHSSPSTPMRPPSSAYPYQANFKSHPFIHQFALYNSYQLPNAPYGAQDAYEFLNKNRTQLLPNEVDTVVTYIDNLLLHDIHNFHHNLSRSAVFDRSLVHDLELFTRKYLTALQAIESRHLGLLEECFSYCYNNLSKDIAEHAFSTLKSATPQQPPRHHIEALLLIAPVCKLHGRALPSQVKSNIRKILHDGQQTICSLVMSPTISMQTISELSLGIVEALMKCYQYFPRLSRGNTDIFNPKWLCEICDQPFKAYTKKVLTFPQKLSLEQLESLKQRLERNYDLWERLRVTSKHSNLVKEVEGHINRIKVELLPVFSHQHKSASPFSSSSTKVASTEPTDQPSAIEKQAEHFKCLSALEEAIGERTIIFVDEFDPEQMPPCEHTQSILAAFSKIAKTQCQFIRPTLTACSFRELIIYRNKIKMLFRLKIKNEDLSLLLREINAHIMLHRMEYAIKSRQASKFTFLKETLEQLEITSLHLHDSLQPRLQEALEEIFVMNLKRIHELRTSNAVVAATEFKTMESLFHKLQKREWAEPVLDLHRFIEQDREDSSAPKFPVLASSLLALTHHQLFSSNDFIITKSIRLFGLANEIRKHKLAGYFSILTATVDETPSLLTNRLEVFGGLLQYPQIAHSHTGKIIRKWEREAAQSMAYIWKPSFENPLLRGIVCELFTMEQDSSIPPVVLYGSQLHCGLQSCIYGISHAAAGKPPADWDVLFIDDDNNLEKILFIIATPLSITEKTIRTIRSVLTGLRSSARTPENPRIEIEVGNTAHKLYVEIRGYNGKDCKRSLKVTIYDTSQEKPYRCLDMDLIPTDIPLTRNCCSLLTVRDESGTFTIRGLNIEALLHRLDLGMQLPETPVHAIDSRDSKQLERFRKSCDQLDSWIKCENKDPNLKLYSISGSGLLNELRQKQQDLNAFLASEREKTEARQSEKKQTEMHRLL